MLNDCNKIHEIDYNSSCCYKHLIIMYDHAETHVLIHKYANLFLKTLNHYFKLDQLSSESLSFEIIKNILNIITRISSHYYYLSKYK
jgi:hypothetical protein